MRKISITCGGEEPRIREERIQQEIMDYEAKRLKAERYGDNDAPSPYMISCFVGDIKGAATGVLSELTIMQERGNFDKADAHLAEACHILNECFVKLARVGKSARKITSFVPFEERFAKEAQ